MPRVHICDYPGCEEKMEEHMERVIVHLSDGSALVPYWNAPNPQSMGDTAELMFCSAEHCGLYFELASKKVPDLRKKMEKQAKETNKAWADLDVILLDKQRVEHDGVITRIEEAKTARLAVIDDMLNYHKQRIKDLTDEQVV